MSQTSSLAVICLTLGLCFTAACTETQTKNNTHSPAPSQTRPVPEEERSSLAVAALALENQTDSVVDHLEAFFEDYLTEDFFKSMPQTRDPEEIQSLIRFHLKFVQEFRVKPASRGRLEKLSARYYQRLLTICKNDFNDCDAITVYNRTIYAGDVFFAADPLIESGRETYVQFRSLVGHPENNIHILNSRLQELNLALINKSQVSVEDINQLTNLMTYLSARTKNIDISTVKTLRQLAKINPDKPYIKKRFERVLTIALAGASNTEVSSIAESYIKTIIKDEGLAKTLSMQKRPGLVQWKGSIESFDALEEWALVFVLLGLKDGKFSGDLHDFYTRNQLRDDEKRRKLLRIARSFVYKQLIDNVYRSHEVVGDHFQQELDRRGSIEALFFDFFDVADRELALIWTNSYRSEVFALAQGLSPFFSAEELSEFSQITAQLDNNIRNLVVYPAHFIIGYYATKQGNFDFTIPLRGGKTLQMNDKDYFNDHFEGRTPNFFNAVQATRSTAQEILLSFYLSLDESILQSYGLNLSFVERFVKNYLEDDRRKIIEMNEDLKQKFASSTDANRFLQSCSRLSKNDFAFDYNLSFKKADSYYFYGQTNLFAGSQSVQGTSREFANFVNIFNWDDINTNLSEDMEYLRVDVGPKINRLRLMKKALTDQAATTKAGLLDSFISSFEKLSEDFAATAENRFRDSVKCIQLHNDIEAKMRKVFFIKEIEMAKTIYAVLRVLNSNEGPLPSVTELRKTNPALFRSPLLNNLSENSDIITELNQEFASIGEDLKRQVRGYQRTVNPTIGFSKEKSSGQYIFRSNRFEERFRRIAFMQDESKQGSQYPTARITEMPADYEQLIETFQKYNDSYSLRLTSERQTESDFVLNYLNTVQFPSAGRETTYEVDRRFVWKNIILNSATISKLKAFNAVKRNYDYGTYTKSVGAALDETFDFLQTRINQLLTSMNIDNEEEAILDALRSQSMMREDGRYNGNELFLYDRGGANIYEMGKYDLFFHVLVSYQLGKKFVLRDRLFLDDPNPVLSAWLPRASTSNGGDTNGDNRITTDEIVVRRDIKNFSITNAPVVKRFSENLMFEIESEAKEIIQHDLFQTLMADYAAADAFILWTKDNRDSEAEKVPYDMDLIRFPSPYQPHALLPSVVTRYYESRSNFDAETFNVFAVESEE